MISVDLVILRISKSGYLKNSEPCYKCLEHMNRLNKKTTYRLRYIYYSDISGNVTKIKFTRMFESDQKHVSMRFRLNNEVKFRLNNELKEKNKEKSPPKKRIKKNS